MPMDGLMLQAVARELNRLLLGGRIDRIQQPEKDEIQMIVRAGGKNHRLLLSSSANHARIHLTQSAKKSMDTPPQLCVLMRKHLINGRIIGVEQTGLDRILRISVESMDELGDYTVKHVIIEIMGRYSNIILTDAQMRIMDSASRVTGDMSRVREVLPHLSYTLPPAQDKVDGRFAGALEISEKLSAQGGQTLDKALLNTLSGLSTQAARELSYRLLMDEKAPPSVWTRHTDTIGQDVKRFFDTLGEEESPTLYLKDGEVSDVTSFRYVSRADDEQACAETISKALDMFYTARDKSERLRQKTAAMTKTLSAALERCERKLAMQLEKRQEVQGREQYRVYGELIMSSIYEIRKGDKHAVVTDYYTEGMPKITISLDETLSPAQNAQKYFRMYAKAKAAAELLDGQIDENRAEIEYLSGQLLNIENMTGEDELAEMRDELGREGYVRRRLKKGEKPKKLPQSTPHVFIAPDGAKIYVGKNNTQNDRLTFSADPDDVWLHAKDIPGSHVIIRLEERKEASDETLLYAASLAAKYSKGKNAPLVPVDFTRRKFVRKPSGAKPGFVVYTHEKQVMVSPAK